MIYDLFKCITYSDNGVWIPLLQSQDSFVVVVVAARYLQPWSQEGAQSITCTLIEQSGCWNSYKFTMQSLGICCTIKKQPLACFVTKISSPFLGIFPQQCLDTFVFRVVLPIPTCSCMMSESSFTMSLKLDFSPSWYSAWSSLIRRSLSSRAIPQACINFLLVGKNGPYKHRQSCP